MRRFSRRETEILEALYRLKEASVGAIRAELDEKPSYDAVRTTLRILEQKGAVTHRNEQRRFIYAPTLAKSSAWKSTARKLADIFFGGSIENAALAMLKLSDADLSEYEISKIENLISKSGKTVVKNKRRS